MFYNRSPLRLVCITLTLAVTVFANFVHARACRVTDFTDLNLNQLDNFRQLAMLSEITATEFKRLKQAKPGDDNYHKIVDESESVAMVNKLAFLALEELGTENFDGYRKVWASDFLTDKAAEDFADCISAREPGLTIVGVPGKDASEFRITLAHITPIGIEQILTRLVAFHNIANIKEFEQFLTDIGPQDNYTAKSFVLKKEDAEKRSVVILRAGWETPDFVYIPSYHQSNPIADLGQ